MRYRVLTDVTPVALARWPSPPRSSISPASRTPQPETKETGVLPWPSRNERLRRRGAGCAAPPTRLQRRPMSRTRIPANCAARTTSISRPGCIAAARSSRPRRKSDGDLRSPGAPQPRAHPSVRPDALFDFAPVLLGKPVPSLPRHALSFARRRPATARAGNHVPDRLSAAAHSICPLQHDHLPAEHAVQRYRVLDSIDDGAPPAGHHGRPPSDAGDALALRRGAQIGP